MKKNYLQKVLALTLAGVMVMGTLTACGDSGNSNSNTDNTNTADTSTSIRKQHK